MRDVLSSKLNKHFAAMGVVAAAVGAGVAQNADAAIVSSGPVNIAIPATTAGVYLNVVTGLTGLTAASVPGWDVNPWSATNLSLFNPTAPSGGVYVLRTGGGAPGNVIGGQLIDGASTYGSGNTATTGNQPIVLNSSDNIIGFRFLNEGTATVNFGWMRLSVGATLTDPARAIVEYAYDDSGAGITTPLIPAPGTAGLLALGAGVMVRRRRAR